MFSINLPAILFTAIFRRIFNEISRRRHGFPVTASTGFTGTIFTYISFLSGVIYLMRSLRKRQSATDLDSSVALIGIEHRRQNCDTSHSFLIRNLKGTRSQQELALNYMALQPSENYQPVTNLMRPTSHAQQRLPSLQEESGDRDSDCEIVDVTLPQSPGPSNAPARSVFTPSVNSRVQRAPSGIIRKTRSGKVYGFNQTKPIKKPRNRRN